MLIRRLDKRASWQAFVKACQLECRFVMLGHGKFALYDEMDATFVAGRNWFYATRAASTVVDGKIVKMHRRILNPPSDMEVDHINHDQLDNRRCNLRICTASENQRNKLKSLRDDLKSKFKGVSFHNDRNEKWVAQIYLPGNQSLHIGAYVTETEAAAAYNEFAQRIYGEFACLNALP